LVETRGKNEDLQESRPDTMVFGANQLDSRRNDCFVRAHIRDRSPWRLVVLIILGDVVDYTGVEERNFSDLAVTDRFGGSLIAWFNLPVLCDAPDEPLGLILALVLVNERDASRNVSRNGLLAQDVFSSGKSLANNVGLNADRQRYNDGVDIIPGEQRVEIAVGRGVKVDARRVGEVECCFGRVCEIGCAGLGSGVDRSELCCAGAVQGSYGWEMG
jgi:hypothetical protein